MRRELTPEQELVQPRSSWPRKLTGFRLEEEDLLALELVKRRYQLSSRTAAVRFLIRWWKAKVNE